MCCDPSNSRASDEYHLDRSKSARDISRVASRCTRSSLRSAGHEKLEAAGRGDGGHHESEEESEEGRYEQAKTRRRRKVEYNDR